MQNKISKGTSVLSNVGVDGVTRMVRSRCQFLVCVFVFLVPGSEDDTWCPPERKNERKHIREGGKEEEREGEREEGKEKKKEGEKEGREKGRGETEKG